MTRFAALILALALFPLTAQAIEAPSEQVHIDARKVLRGNFVEEHRMSGAKGPMQSSGHFTVAPAYGLIWGIEQPFPTSTIITPNGATQDIGGLAVKLPAKHLHHLYTIIGGALAGDWGGLAQDFSITRGGDARHWQMLLTPRQGGKPRLPYATITVSGARFVEKIVMTKADGNYDALRFSDEVLASIPLSAREAAAFKEARP